MTYEPGAGGEWAELIGSASSGFEAVLEKRHTGEPSI
jgi:hypothetical protein